MFRDKLRRVVEELFFSNALAFPALIGEFFHVDLIAIQPLEIEYPANDHNVAIHEKWTHAFGAH